MPSKYLLVIALLATANSHANSRMERFNENFTRTGEMKNCVSLYNIRSTRVLDSEHILFRQGTNRYFLNTLPYKCSGLGFQRSFAYTTSLSRLCHIDTITVLDDFTHFHGHFTGPRCGLGKFERVEKVEAVQASE